MMREQNVTTLMVFQRGRLTLSGLLFFLLALAGGGEGRGVAGGLEVVEQLVSGGELVVAGHAVEDTIFLMVTLCGVCR